MKVRTDYDKKKWKEFNRYVKNEQIGLFFFVGTMLLALLFVLTIYIIG
tara:strand:- start:2289 stop:2432 length:144 start_codon:yes stop_codon:yes gene_type:complete